MIETVYIVKFSDWDISEIDSIYKNKENAQKRIKELREEETEAWVETWGFGD